VRLTDADETPAPVGPSWNEADRLAALDRYAVLDTPREPEFDDIVRLASDILGAPISVINLIASGRQWFKAEVGIGADELPLDVSICAHAILQPDVFVVPDTTKDSRFDRNPLVTGDPGLRFYAGALLTTPEGLPLGTMCVLDTEPRPEGITDHQRLALEVLARQVMTQLELRRAIADRDERAGQLEAEVEGRRGVDLAYRESEERYRLAARATNDAIWDWEFATNHVLWNDALFEAYGHRLADVRPTGDWWIEHIHPEDRARIDESIHAAIDGTAESWTDEYRFRRADGSYADVLDRGHVIRDAEGRATRMIGAMLDLSERRRTEAALAENEERLRLALDVGEIGEWDVDVLNDVLMWPPRVKAMFGISPDVPVTMQDFFDGLHPGDRDATGATYAAAIDPERRALYDVEYRTIGKEDDVVRWVAAKGRGLFDAEGRCTRILGTAIDITARKRTEQALRELNDTLERRVADALAERKLLADLVEGTDAFVQVADLDFRWLAINKAAADEFERIFGIRPVVGQSMLDLLEDRPEDREAVRSLWARALAGEQFTEIAEFGDPSLKRHFYEIKFNTLLNAAGERIGAYQFVYDVTQRVEEQHRLADTEAALR